MGSAYFPGVNNPLTFCLPSRMQPDWTALLFRNLRICHLRVNARAVPWPVALTWSRAAKGGGFLHLTNDHISRAQHTVLPLGAPWMNKWIPEKGSKVFRANLTQSPGTLWEKESVVLLFIYFFKWGTKGNLWGQISWCGPFLHILGYLPLIPGPGH